MIYKDLASHFWQRAGLGRVTAVRLACASMRLPKRHLAPTARLRASTGHLHRASQRLHMRRLAMAVPGCGGWAAAEESEHDPDNRVGAGALESRAHLPLPRPTRPDRKSWQPPPGLPFFLRRLCIPLVNCSTRCGTGVCCACKLQTRQVMRRRGPPLSRRTTPNTFTGAVV